MSEKELYRQVKELIAKKLKFKKLDPAKIKDDTLLFDKQKGLGLDSIDLLELIVGLEKEFGVSIPDRKVGEKVLVSVRTIVEFIRVNAVNKKK